MTPSQQIIHNEMMKNLKLLHTTLDANQQSEKNGNAGEKLQEMEDLKANLNILGLV